MDAQHPHGMIMTGDETYACELCALYRRVEELSEERKAIIDVLGCPQCAWAICNDHREALEEERAALSRKGA